VRRQHGSRTRPACRKYCQPGTTRNKTHRTPLYSPLGRGKEQRFEKERKANKDFRNGKLKMKKGRGSKI
jgi:hypothetical protein